MTNKAFAMELLAIKQEITQLRTTSAIVMEQIKTTITLLHDNPSQPVSNSMDTETEYTIPTNLSSPNTTPPPSLDLPAIIIEL